MHENRRTELSTTYRDGLLDWSWSRGWDDEQDGPLDITCTDDRPVQESWHAVKFWWPHGEAVIATLLAWTRTGDERYAEWHTLVHDWAHAHFPDPEFGEWHGSLHRDGSSSSILKGNWWKGPFHLPRMQLECWRPLSGARAEPTKDEHLPGGGSTCE